MVLSRLATLIASIALPGLLVYHEPNSPSLPAAIVTILPERAMREATVEVVDSVHPSEPPKDKVMIS